MRNLPTFLLAAGVGVGGSVAPFMNAGSPDAMATMRTGSNSPPSSSQVEHRSTAAVSPDNDPTKRTTKTYVQVQIVFLKIGEIDTLKQQYSADISIQATWREPSLDGKTQDELKIVKSKKLWNPHLFVENAMAEQKDSSFQSAFVNDDGEAFVTERRKLRGVFFENLELELFPFDVQDLSVTVVSERPEDEVELVPDAANPSSVNVGTFSDEQSWRLYRHVEVTRKMVTMEVANQLRQNSAIQATCRAGRRPGYFYYNVFLVMMFISAMSFAAFSVDYKLPHNRLSLSFTLLLTSITFKMVITRTLPSISYLTYMDKYVLMSLGFLVLVCIWHAVVPTIGAETDFPDGTENWIILALGVLYLVGHIAFAFFVYVNAWGKRNEMSRKDREFVKGDKSPGGSHGV